MRNREKWKQYLVSNAISLGVGAVSALLTAGSMKKYKLMNQPPLAPPGWIFPIVWTILYVCMATAAAMIYQSKSKERTIALRYYAAQLIINALWPVLFFDFEAFWSAFFWLLLLWYLVFETTRQFFKINQKAGKLMLPYLAWITFAAYLNLGVAILN